MISDFNKKNSATITDIARLCGVAISTVSIALRGDSRVKPATARRIQQAAESLGYDPVVHDAARRLLSGHRNKIIINQIAALALPPNFHQTLFFNTMTWGIMDVLNKEDFSLLNSRLFTNESLSELSDPIPPIFRRGEIDGLIVFAGAEIAKSLSKLRELPGFGNRPIISLIHDIPDIICVLADEEEGGYQSAMHLLNLGHRHIAHFVHEVIFQGVPIADNLQKRLNGVRRAISDFGLNPDKSLTMLPVPTKWADPSGLPNTIDDSSADNTNIEPHPIIQQILQQSEITGILALNDSVAINLWFHLRRAGLSVPDDISVIGFDDTNPMLNDLGQNILTTVRLPLREIGRTAAKELISNIINNQVSQDKNIIILPVELITRKSTSPPGKQT